MTEPCLGALIQSAFSLWPPPMVAGEGNWASGCQFSEELAAAWGRGGLPVCRGRFVCVRARGRDVPSEGLKERQPHFTPCSSHQRSAPLPRDGTAADSTAPHTTGTLYTQLPGFLSPGVA